MPGQHAGLTGACATSAPLSICTRKKKNNLESETTPDRFAMRRLVLALLIGAALALTDDADVNDPTDDRVTPRVTLDYA